MNEENSNDLLEQTDPEALKYFEQQSFSEENIRETVNAKNNIDMRNFNVQHNMRSAFEEQKLKDLHKRQQALQTPTFSSMLQASSIAANLRQSQRLTKRRSIKTYMQGPNEQRFQTEKISSNEKRKKIALLGRRVTFDEDISQVEIKNSDHSGSLIYKGKKRDLQIQIDNEDQDNEDNTITNTNNNTITNTMNVGQSGNDNRQEMEHFLTQQQTDVNEDSGHLNQEEISTMKHLLLQQRAELDSNMITSSKQQDTGKNDEAQHFVFPNTHALKQVQLLHKRVHSRQDYANVFVNNIKKAKLKVKEDHHESNRFTIADDDDGQLRKTMTMLDDSSSKKSESDNNYDYDNQDKQNIKQSKYWDEEHERELAIQEIKEEDINREIQRCEDTDKEKEQTTEMNLSSSFEVSKILTSIFDNSQFGDNGITRLQIQSTDDIYLFLRDFMFAELFDEVSKAQNENPYFDQNKDLFSNLVNETNHFIQGYNYIVGLRLTFRKINWKQNNNTNGQKVLNIERDNMFNIEKPFDEFKSAIKYAPKKQFTWNEGDGQYKTGAYTQVILGKSTYQEALLRLNETFEAGWYEDDSLLYLGVELFTYNENTHNGGFLTFSFWRNPDFDIQTENSIFLPIDPAKYDDFIEFPIIILMFYTYKLWFENFSRRKTFFLPLQSIQEYYDCLPFYFVLFKFCNISPILVIFLIVKILQILSFYIPSFGVLFDTIKRLKDDGIGFFVMAFIIMVGFTIAGTVWFGSHSSYFYTIWWSGLQIFYILVNQFDYEELYNSNQFAAPIFFYPSNLIIYNVFYFMFLGVIIGIYNKIRQKKQLESEAIARIFINDYSWKLKLWKNLIMCNLDIRTKEEFHQSQENKHHEKKEKQKQKEKLKKIMTQNINDLNVEQYKELMDIDENKEKDLKQSDFMTIFLYNKVKVKYILLI